MQVLQKEAGELLVSHNFQGCVEHACLPESSRVGTCDDNWCPSSFLVEARSDKADGAPAHPPCIKAGLHHWSVRLFASVLEH